ncbi:MAG: CopG family transcriptional regulator [Thermoplasmata archaeon]|nr:MAG: CopG family transcriptional regulator [Thermoplasmata archaeon]
MIPIQIRITRRVVEEIDELIRAGLYSTRSEFIRDAARKHLMSIKGIQLERKRFEI